MLITCTIWLMNLKIIFTKYYYCVGSINYYFRCKEHIPPTIFSYKTLQKFLHCCYANAVRTKFRIPRKSQSKANSCFVKTYWNWVYTLKSWKYNNTRNTISLSVSKIPFTFLKYTKADLKISLYIQIHIK